MGKHHRLTVIMVDAVMAMSMHRPSQVFLKPVRMPVLRNHLRVLLEHVKHCGDMGGRGHD